jgi:heterodisulfide reductase subunit C
MREAITPKTMDDGFVKKLGELSGQNVHLCMQCGTCAGSCPMSEHMAFSVRKVMHLAKLGLVEILEDLNSCWSCASCHTCTVRCPREIDIARVMDALRQMTLRTNQNYIEPSQVSEEALKEYPQIAMVASFRKLTS